MMDLRAFLSFVICMYVLSVAFFFLSLTVLYVQLESLQTTPSFCFFILLCDAYIPVMTFHMYFYLVYTFCLYHNVLSYFVRLDARFT